ncbi:troponin I [Tetranychus urticae]|uniref:troponin I n=1 Tax=Tetranychus urticae TaxID=32264 RepID=UPI00077BABDE|nr:troponin I [Tetranychus urticae]
MESEDERYRREDKERKKAEVRRRLEEQAKAAKGKRGFLTPDRKKKLRVLLRKKAAEELKREQERKAQERKRVIRERTGQPKHNDARNEAELMKICKEYHKRITSLADANYDVEQEVKRKDITLQELNAQVCDLRGKFIKPTLKKVSKYEQKLERMREVAQKAAMDFRGTLKKVKSGVFNFTDTDTEPKKAEKSGEEEI